jgi:hypothetical protein
MKKYVFLIIPPTGENKYITAESRKKAIEIYLQKTGMPLDFFQKHCKIINKGVLTQKS